MTETILTPDMLAGRTVRYAVVRRALPHDVDIFGTFDAANEFRIALALRGEQADVQTITTHGEKT